MNRERRSLAQLAFDLEQAAMVVDDVLDDGKTKAGAAQLAGPRGVDPIEPLGQAGKMITRNPLALVADRHRERRRAFGGRRGLDRNRGAGPGIFDGVVDQILKHLGQLLESPSTGGWPDGTATSIVMLRAAA